MCVCVCVCVCVFSLSLIKQVGDLVDAYLRMFLLNCKIDEM